MGLDLSSAGLAADVFLLRPASDARLGWARAKLVHLFLLMQSKARLSCCLFPRTPSVEEGKGGERRGQL